MLRSLRLRSGVRSFDRVVVELEDSGRAPRINAIRLLDGSGGGAVAPVPGAELPGDSRDAVWATGVVKPFRQDSSYSFVALDGDAGDAFLVRSLRQELAQGDEVRVRLEDAGKGAPRIVEVKRVGWRDPRIAKKRRLEEGALPSKERGNARPAWTLTRPQRACVEALLRAIGLQSGQLVMTLCCGRLRWAWVKGMRCELLAPSFDMGANEIMAFSMALDAGECSEECGFVIDMDCVLCQKVLCAFLSHGGPTHAMKCTCPPCELMRSCCHFVLRRGEGEWLPISWLSRLSPVHICCSTVVCRRLSI